MSTIASQVILHPAASRLLKIWATTNGRDKTYRAIQFFARSLAWFLIKYGWKEESVRWNALKGHLGTGRKLLRLFKPLENLQVALKTAQKATPNQLEQITTIGRQLSYAAYLSFDALVWANSIRFLTLTPARASKNLKLSLRFWLSGIILSIIHGMIKASRLAKQAKLLSLESGSYTEKLGTDADKTTKLGAVQAESAGVRSQLFIDVLDLWIPAAGLGLVDLNDGIVGMLGLITSLKGLMDMWVQVK